MHLPPRTCPVRRISGDLRSSDPRVCGCSSCDLPCLRPPLLPCVVLRVLGLGMGWSFFFPLAMSVAEACPVVSWQHAIHGGISVFRDRHIKWFQRQGGKKTPPSQQTRSQLSEFGRSQDFGPGREAVTRPLGIHSACRWVLTDQCQSNMPNSLSKPGVKHLSVLTRKTPHYAKASWPAIYCS